MKSTRRASPIAEAVAAYCNALEIPAFDEGTITSSHRACIKPIARSRPGPRIAAYVAATIALLALLSNVPTVVARVQRVFAAFTVGPAGRTLPMTIRQVTLKRARAEMPFTVIVPPAINGAQIVAVEEVYAPASPLDASIIFEIREAAAGPQVMIIENSAARQHPATFFALRGPADSTVSPPLDALDRRTTYVGHTPKILLRDGNGNRTSSPAAWVTRGTRVIVMSPPGSLSNKQLKAIQSTMSW